MSEKYRPDKIGLIGEDPKLDRLEKVSTDPLIRSQFSNEEWALYIQHEYSPDKSLSVDEETELFKLFLCGFSLEQLRETQPRSSIGSIIKARIDGKWDLRRDEYRNRVFKEIKGRVQQVALESANFMSDVLTVAHQKFGKNIQEYLSTGDETKLESFGIKNMRNYQEAVRLFMEVTGMNNQQKVVGEIVHKHEVENKQAKALNSSQASKMLELLDVGLSPIDAEAVTEEMPTDAEFATVEEKE